MKRFLIILSAFITAFVTTSNAQATEITKLDLEYVTAELISKSKTLHAGTNHFAIMLDHEDQWHTYYKNPGDAGIATSLTLKNAPEDIQVSSLVWPQPYKFPFPPNLTNYGYKDVAILPFTIEIPKSYVGKKVSLTAELNTLICKDICLPGFGEFSITRQTKAEPVINNTHAYYIKKGYDFVPQNSTESFDINVDNQNVILHFKTVHIPKLFIPSDEGVINDSQAQKFIKTNTGYKLILEKDDYLEALPENFGGILVLKDNSALAYGNAQHAATAPNLSTVQDEDTIVETSLFVMLAFIGGLILNLMPCVLPVLSLKVMSLVKYKDSGAGYIHGLYYTLGVVLSFLILASTLVILKQSGEAIGWGFQLQNPTFVIILIALLSFISLSLFGVFNIGTSLTQLEGKKVYKSGKLNAFMAGILATIVATPCTAPFMGVSMAYALSQDNITTYLVFVSLGLGLAFPYLLLSFKPSALKFIPKPGAWMERFKQFLGFPMLASILWLLWVIAAQKGSDAVLIALMMIFVLSLISWIYGNFVSLKGSKTYRFISSLILIVLSLFAIQQASQSIHTLKEQATSPQQTVINFDKQKIKTLNAEGKTVFLRFTANWCITCKANEKLVINTTEVQTALNNNNIVQMVADWTNKSEKIAQEIERLGRSGIPLYVFFYPNGKEVILPEVINKSLILAQINKSY